MTGNSLWSSCRPWNASWLLLLAGLASCADPSIGEQTITTRQSSLFFGRATDVAGGGFHSCARLDTGSVLCWGRGDTGALGDGNSANSLVPVTVSGLGNATSISAGELYTCARRATGAVSCWGQGFAGQLGNGDTAASPTPVDAFLIGDALKVAAGTFHTCIVRASGQVACWGTGGAGQLGNGTSGPGGFSLLPVTVSGISDAVDVAVGMEHSCAVRETGAVVCWGFGEFGALGTGTFANSSIPVPTLFISDAIGIAAGEHHTCAVRSTGRVACWGSGNFGKLGGTVNDTSFPVTVDGLLDAETVTAGQHHTCALRASGDVACWGFGSFGQLGNGTTAANNPTFANITGLPDAVSVSAGKLHTCAVRATGEVLCWGSGGNGQIGNGGTSNTSVPERVGGLSENSGVACSGDGECFSGFCVDGVCCNTACGDGDANDCQACSNTAGSTDKDGTCAPRAAGISCPDDGNACTTDQCDGSSTSCQHPAGNDGATCYTRPADNLCASVEAITSCTGDPVCPSPTAWPPETCMPVATGTDITVEISGGADSPEPGGVTVEFQGTVTTPGQTAVVESGVGCPPATGFQVLGQTQPDGTGVYYDINTTAVYTTPPPVRVCIHYDPALIDGSEDNLRLMHGNTTPGGDCDLSAAGWTNMPGNICKSDGCRAISTPCVPCSPPATICGTTTTLSPFAIMEPRRESIPRVDVPDPIVVEAGFAGGTKVTYHASARDPQDGWRPVHCSHRSGSFFPLGVTTVTCTATDRDDLLGSATFTVTVRDTTGPVFKHVPDTIFHSTGHHSARVHYPEPTAHDAVDGPRSVTCTPESGSRFSIGRTVVTCTASDRRGNTSEARFTIWVRSH